MCEAAPTTNRQGALVQSSPPVLCAMRDLAGCMPSEWDESLTFKTLIELHST